MNTPLLTV